MNPFTTPDNIFIYSKPQDMRAGIQRLASLVTTDFGMEPCDGALFVFVSRDKEKVKMLRFEGNGWCLYYVRLLDEGFRFTHSDDTDFPVTKLERRELLWLLEGLDVVQPKASLPIAQRNLL